MSFLPGMFPGASSAKLTSLSQVLSATSTDSTTITAPNGIAGNTDLIVLLDYIADSTTAPAAAVPSGFTQIVTATINTARLVLSYKLADGTEGGNSLTGMTYTDGGGGKALYVFRGNASISSVNLSSPASQATDSNPSAQNVAASAGTPPLIVIGCYTSTTVTSVDPRTFSTTKDGELEAVGTFVDVWIAYKIYNSGPGDTSIDMDDEGSNNILASVYIACS